MMRISYERGVCLAHSSRRILSIMLRKTWMAPGREGVVQKQEAGRPLCISTQEANSKQEVRPVYKTSRPTPSDFLPLSGRSS